MQPWSGMKKKLTFFECLYIYIKYIFFNKRCNFSESPGLNIFTILDSGISVHAAHCTSSSSDHRLCEDFSSQQVGFDFFPPFLCFMYLEQTNKSPKPEDRARWKKETAGESNKNPVSMRYISSCSCQLPVTNTGKRK